MQIIYSQQTTPKELTKSIFLAGCTPRTEDIISWRKEAVKFLEQIEYDGVVFIPEFKDGKPQENLDYSAQIEWEEKCLNMSDVILFYIPRNNTDMLGLTTNDEYGVWKKSGKVVLAIPDDSYKTRYQEYYAKKYNVPVFNKLTDGLLECVEQLGNGSLRKDGECSVPLSVWDHSAFKNWYKSLTDADNILIDSKVEYTKYVGKNSEILFFITLWADVFITSENRHKTNEVVIMRNDISSCLLFKKDDNDILNSDIVLVSEFRTPVSNYTGKVHELASGSTFKKGMTAKEIVVQEIQEETGLTIDESKMVEVKNRQLQATTLSHKSALFLYELNEDELQYIKDSNGKVFGDEESTERTYINLVKLKSILDTDTVDWSTIGMIFNGIMSN
jgi:hypothetical protein